MDMSLAERVAIITGGANGIGRATAQTFAAAGATVIIWDHSADAGQDLADEITASGGRAVVRAVDVVDQGAVAAAVQDVVEQFGRIDILINNAGITRDAQLVKVKQGEVVGSMSAADFDAVLHVNLKGVFTCTQAVVPIMVRQGYGRIVSAASVVALYGNFGQTNYAASKAGVIAMTKVWARELGKHGITANAVAPGFIATAMTQAMPARALHDMLAHTPVGRAGEPRDVAYAYLFLASEAASFINGAVLSVDGGLVVGT